MYKPSDIKVLKFPEVVRKRPGMYVGNTNEEGVEHLILECVANVVDLFLAKKATKVSIKLDGNKIVIHDDGPGLPFDLEAPDQSSSLAEYFMTHMHHTPSYDGHEPHFHLASFGVGLAVVNAVCKSMTIDTWCNGAKWHARFMEGHIFGSPQITSEGNGRGTTMTLQPDTTIFSETRPRKSIIGKKLFETAHLVPGMIFEFDEERYVSEKGLADLIHILGDEDNTNDKNIKPFYHRELIGEYEVHAAASDNGFPRIRLSPKNVLVRSWVNGAPTRKHGSHVNGFELALQKVAWVPEKVLIHVVTSKPGFSGRTRDELCRGEVEEIVCDSLSKPLCDYVEKNRNSG